MNEYEVIITPEAEGDLDQLGAYITFELKAPETAFSYVRDIRTERKARSSFRTLFTRNEIFRRCWRNYIVTLMNYKSP